MTVNKTLLQPFKDPHGRLNCLEMIMTDAPWFDSHSHGPAAHTPWLPAELGTPLRKKHLSAALDGC